jgi:hypothetical protein
VPYPPGCDASDQVTMRVVNIQNVEPLSTKISRECSDIFEVVAIERGLIRFEGVIQAELVRCLDS